MARIPMSEIAAVVGKRRKLASKKVEKFISMMFVVINEGLDADKQVKVKGLGTFKVTSVKSRESVNVNTGERVVIEGHDKVSFTPETVLRDLVNKPFAQFETVVLNENVVFSDTESVDSEQEPSSDVPDETVNVPEKTDETPADAGNGPVGIPVTQGKKLAGTQGMVVTDKEKATVQSTDETKDEPKIVGMKAKDDNQERSLELPDDRKENFDNTTENTVGEKDTLCDDRDDFETLYHESRRRNRRVVLLAMAASLICLVVGVVFGTYFGDMLVPKKSNVELASNKPKHISKVKKKQSVTVAKPVEKKPEPAVRPQEGELDLDRMNADSRVRIGAYDIVGIDTVVTLRSGQTMKSYCNATLGAGMLCYFQVLNDTNELGEGNRLKVPKVRYKKKR